MDSFQIKTLIFIWKISSVSPINDLGWNFLIDTIRVEWLISKYIGEQK